jgi:transcriptional regulator with XRE-family HTH domain
MQRMVRGVSQSDLENTVGVTFQQIQKYERGVNRVRASRLHQTADALEVTPEFFSKKRQKGVLETPRTSLPLTIFFSREMALHYREHSPRLPMRGCDAVS